jgi:DNA gyrase subunit B
MTNQDTIQVLKGLEAVRLRPGMYIGGTDKKALHHILWEVFDNCVDEHMAKDAKGNPFCNTIQVVIQDDGETILISDNGRGIPVTVHSEYQEEGISQLELALTRLHAGGKFTHDTATGGLHGVGVSCVNAVSDYLEVIVNRDGGTFIQKYSRGVPTTTLDRIGNSNSHGTAITFHPDPEIFTDTLKYDEEIIVNRLREAAMLNGGLTIKFVNRATGRKETFYYESGIADYVKYLTSNKSGTYPAEPISGSGNFKHVQTNKNIEVQFSLQYSEDDNEIVKTFANNIHNPDGGTHLSGFKTCLTRIINQYARSSGALKEKSPNLSGDDIREGITAVISVRIPQPQFESQTKVKLVSNEAESAVNSIMSETLNDFFDKNPAIISQIVKRALTAQEAREAAKKTQEMIKRKSVLGKSYRLPGKLSDCNSEDRSRTELFLVEGDSAAGPAVNGRDAEFQAILPLRGKIINAEKHDLASLLKNQEVQDVISAIGTGISIGSEDNEFDISKLRYDKIIILTDADVDGAHISTLILAFFYRLMPELIMQGHVYLAKPPLFRIKSGKEIHYAFTIEERDAIISKCRSKVEVTRFKGLGEMNFDELRDTTMDVASRRLVKVDVPDKIEADSMLSILMGNNIAARKEHIIKKSLTRATQIAN